MEQERYGLADSPNSDEQLKAFPTYKIMRWLEENYCYEDDICLPRCLIYEHYSDHCQRNSLSPINAASFGKLVHQQFPNITTRRLGTRGQSKYHYFGLGIKKTSRYYDNSYQQKSQQNNGRKEGGGRFSHKHYKTKEKPSSVLPPFPSIQEIKECSVPELSLDRVRTFIVMYQAHCQRIYDSIIRANFSEIGNFLLHFWQAMPPHMMSILEDEGVLNLIAYCDHVLYTSIANVLIITPLHNVPDSLAKDIFELTENFLGWAETALGECPQSLITLKMEVLNGMCSTLKRLTSLAQLSNATRVAIKGLDSQDQMRRDWKQLDLKMIASHTMWIAQSHSLPQHLQDMINILLDEYGHLVSSGLTLEDSIEWIESIVDRLVTKDGDLMFSKGDTSLGVFCQMWTFMSAKVIRELVYLNASSMSVFQLLSNLLDYYIIHAIENRRSHYLGKTYLEKVHASFIVEEKAVPPPPDDVSDETTKITNTADQPHPQLPNQPHPQHPSQPHPQHPSQPHPQLPNQPHPQHPNQPHPQLEAGKIQTLGESSKPHPPVSPAITSMAFPVDSSSNIQAPFNYGSTLQGAQLSLSGVNRLDPALSVAMASSQTPNMAFPSSQMTLADASTLPPVGVALPPAPFFFRQPLVSGPLAGSPSHLQVASSQPILPMMAQNPGGGVHPVQMLGYVGPSPYSIPNGQISSTTAMTILPSTVSYF